MNLWTGKIMHMYWCIFSRLDINFEEKNLYTCIQGLVKEIKAPLLLEKSGPPAYPRSLCQKTGGEGQGQWEIYLKGPIRWISKEHWLLKKSVTFRGPLQGHHSASLLFSSSSPFFFFASFFPFHFLERRRGALWAPLKSEGLISLYTALPVYVHVKFICINIKKRPCPK